MRPVRLAPCLAAALVWSCGSSGGGPAPGPGPGAPTPAAANMYPSWLTVEYARTFLMSVAVIPIVAAKIAVRAPTAATTAIASGACT